jgi:hypothetical protein
MKDKHTIYVSDIWARVPAARIYDRHQAIGLAATNARKRPARADTIDEIKANQDRRI